MLSDPRFYAVSSAVPFNLQHVCRHLRLRGCLKTHWEIIISNLASTHAFCDTNLDTLCCYISLLQQQQRGCQIRAAPLRSCTFPTASSISRYCVYLNLLATPAKAGNIYAGTIARTAHRARSASTKGISQTSLMLSLPSLMKSLPLYSLYRPRRSYFQMFQIYLP
jgi:hypothetical protein